MAFAFISYRSVDECGSTCLSFERDGNKCMGFMFDPITAGNSYGTCSFLKKYERGIQTSKYATNNHVTVWTTNSNFTLGNVNLIGVDKKGEMKGKNDKRGRTI